VSPSEEAEAADDKGETKSSLVARLKAWAGKGASPQRASPTKSAGEIWYFLNSALDIDDPNHTHHPGLIIGGEDDTVFVLKGTSDPTRHSDAFAVHPSDCDGKLRGSTYFSVASHYPIADTSSAFGYYVGNLSKETLARIREYRHRALAEPKP
jgi:hypothetical protein